MLYKTIAINNFSSNTEDFQEVKQIYHQIYNKIKPICPKILLFELNRQANISSLRTYDKKLFIKTLSEVRKLLKLIDKEFKPLLKISLFYLYVQYGNFKKAKKFLKDLDLNSQFVKEAELILKFSNCEYKHIIKTDEKFHSKLSNLNYQFLKAFSHLMLGNYNQAIEIITNMERVENVKEIPIFFGKFYSFLSIYYKMLNEDEKSNEALSLVMNYQSLNDLDITKAIYYRDKSYFKGFTIQQAILGHYLEGRINKAVELARNNENIHFLKVCAILIPKSIKKFRKYKEFSDILDYTKKPIIKLFILRNEPTLIIENKTYALRPNQVFSSIVKLIRKRSVPVYIFNKNTLKYLRKIFRGLLSVKRDEVILDAKVYFDLDELLTIYKTIETTRNIDELKNALSKFNKIYKALPFSNKKFIRNQYIIELREEIENYLRKIKTFSNWV